MLADPLKTTSDAELPRHPYSQVGRRTHRHRSPHRYRRPHESSTRTLAHVTTTAGITMTSTSNVRGSSQTKFAGDRRSRHATGNQTSERNLNRSEERNHADQYDAISRPGVQDLKHSVTLMNPREVRKNTFASDVWNRMLSMTETTAATPNHSNTTAQQHSSSNARPVTPHPQHSPSIGAGSKSAVPGTRLSLVTPRSRGPPAWATPRTKTDSPPRNLSAVRGMHAHSSTRSPHRPTSPVHTMARSPLIAGKESPNRMKRLEDTPSPPPKPKVIRSAVLSNLPYSDTENSLLAVDDRHNILMKATQRAELSAAPVSVLGSPRYHTGSGILPRTPHSSTVVSEFEEHTPTQGVSLDKVTSAAVQAPHLPRNVTSAAAEPFRDQAPSSSQSPRQSTVAILGQTPAMRKGEDRPSATPRMPPTQSAILPRGVGLSQSGMDSAVADGGDFSGSAFHPAPTRSQQKIEPYGGISRSTKPAEFSADALLSRSASAVGPHKTPEQLGPGQKRFWNTPTTSSTLDDDQVSATQANLLTVKPAISTTNPGASPAPDFSPNAAILRAGNTPADLPKPTFSTPQSVIVSPISGQHPDGPSAELIPAENAAPVLRIATDATPTGPMKGLPELSGGRVMHNQPLYVRTIVNQLSGPMPSMAVPPPTPGTTTAGPVVTSRRVVRRSMIYPMGEGLSTTQPTKFTQLGTELAGLSLSMPTLTSSDSPLKLFHRRQSHDEAHRKLLADHINPPLGASRADRRYYDFLADDVVSLRQVIMAEAAEMPPPPAPPELPGPPPVIPAIIGLNKAPMKIPTNLELESRSGYLVPLPRRTLISRKIRNNCQLC